jgi:hypothetical protein
MISTKKETSLAKPQWRRLKRNRVEDEDAEEEDDDTSL